MVNNTFPEVVLLDFTWDEVLIFSISERQLMVILNWIRDDFKARALRDMFGVLFVPGTARTQYRGVLRMPGTVNHLPDRSCPHSQPWAESMVLKNASCVILNTPLYKKYLEMYLMNYRVNSIDNHLENFEIHLQVHTRIVKNRGTDRVPESSVWFIWNLFLMTS